MDNFLCTTNFYKIICLIMKLNKFMLRHISVFLGVICMFFVTACQDEGNTVIPPIFSISPEAADITFSAEAASLGTSRCME